MRNNPDKNETTIVPWKRYLLISSESVITFYLATFCLALYFTHQGFDYLISSIALICLYIFIIGVCIKRLIAHLSIAALMLVIPIAPLLALTIVISLIPVLQWLR
jgi:hypothetical protein